MRTFWVAVSSVILRMPSASRMFDGSSALYRCLLEVVDRDVLQHVAVQVVADDLDDLLAEVLTVLEQLHEVDLLADRLQRLGELRVEQEVHRLAIGRAARADGLGDLQDVVGRLVHPQVERDDDVRAHVVGADQPVPAASIHLERD